MKGTSGLTKEAIKKLPVWLLLKIEQVTKNIKVEKQEKE